MRKYRKTVDSHGCVDIRGKEFYVNYRLSGQTIKVTEESEDDEDSILRVRAEDSEGTRYNLGYRQKKLTKKEIKELSLKPKILSPETLKNIRDMFAPKKSVKLNFWNAYYLIKKHGHTNVTSDRGALYVSVPLRQIVDGGSK